MSARWAGGWSEAAATLACMLPPPPAYIDVRTLDEPRAFPPAERVWKKTVGALLDGRGPNWHGGEEQQENSCSHEMFLAGRVRKTRTPAGFVTTPSKQQPQKVPERYLRNALNSRKTRAATKCSLRSACERLEHQQVSWPTLQNSSHKKCPNVTYGMP